VRVCPDTNVLYSARLINLIMRSHAAGIINLAWSDDLLDELQRIFIDRKGVPIDKALAIAEKIREWAPDGAIRRSEYRNLISEMSGPDRTDHVHSAAVRCAGVDVLLTNNTKDFPRRDVGASCRVVTPATFFGELAVQFPAEFARIIRESSAAFRRPPRSPESLLDDLEAVGLLRFAKAVRTEIRRR
jgi:hypothetical protein